MFDPFDDDFTSEIPRFRMSLRITGDTLDPEFLTQQLGVVPTSSARKGDEPAEGSAAEHETGEWSYHLAVPADTELGDVLDMLLAPFPDDSTLWEELTSTYAVEIRCEAFLEADVQRTRVGPELFQRLARFALPLTIVFHRAGGDAPDAR